MTVPDEKFFAWLDGELSPDEAALVEAEVARSPELARTAEQHRAMQSRLKSAFDTVAEAPVPGRLRPNANVVDFVAAKRARAAGRWGSPAQWAAMAATLPIGIFKATLIVPRASGQVEVHGGRLYGEASLNRALENELES